MGSGGGAPVTCFCTLTTDCGNESTLGKSSSEDVCWSTNFELAIEIQRKMRIKISIMQKKKEKYVYMLKMTWMRHNQWIWVDIFSIVVCSFLPFPENKHHEESKKDEFKLLAPQSIYAPQSHPLLMFRKNPCKSRTAYDCTNLLACKRRGKIK